MSMRWLWQRRRERLLLAEAQTSSSSQVYDDGQVDECGIIKVWDLRYLDLDSWLLETWINTA